MPLWLLFPLGLIALLVGADLLVRGASRIALAMGIAPLVVGLTVVALGTSSPELAISLGAALKGNGATVRYVVLPLEAHGYRARESVGHTLWETVRWLDQYVKNAGPRN